MYHAVLERIGFSYTSV